VDAIEDAVQRLRRLDEQSAIIVPSWSLAPVVQAYQAMRGVSFLVVVTLAAEIGDLRRFATARQLMSFLGLVPGERSTGDTVRRKGLTLAGNRRARRALIEAAWTYRYPARVSPIKQSGYSRQYERLRAIGPSSVVGRTAAGEMLADAAAKSMFRLWSL
jgi:transposase